MTSLIHGLGLSLQTGDSDKLITAPFPAITPLAQLLQYSLPASLNRSSVSFPSLHIHLPFISFSQLQLTIHPTVVAPV